MKGLITVILSVSLFLVACSTEDENKLVGEWRNSSMTADYILTFYDDNRFSYDYIGEGSFLREGSGKYSYNQKQQTLTLMYTSKSRTDLYIVQTLSEDMLVLLDSDDLYAWSFSKGY